MQASAPETFAPLPLRPRGTLEILDTSVKVYKRYFWVLVAWSAIVNAFSAVGFIPILSVLSYLAIFLTPLMTGPVACAIAAAVRGQTVSFKAGWEFTKPRYWSMLGFYLLALVIAGGIFLALMLVCGVIVLLGFLIFKNASGAIQATMSVIAALVLGTAVTIVGLVVTIWMSMVPIVVAMEEDKHNTQALARAFQLLRGQWMRLVGLMTVLGLGMLVLMGILGGTAAVLIGIPTIKDLFMGRTTDASVWMGVAGFLGSYTVLLIIYSPIYYLIITLFYLDMRVRKEALDLEWADHTSAPPAGAGRPVVEMPARETWSTTVPAGAVPAATDFASPVADFGVAEAASSPAVAPPSPAATQLLTDTAAPAPGVAGDTEIVCSQCGTRAAATQVFCMRCGTRLAAAP